MSDRFADELTRAVFRRPGGRLQGLLPFLFPLLIRPHLQHNHLSVHSPTLRHLVGVVKFGRHRLTSHTSWQIGPSHEISQSAAQSNVS